MICYNTRWGYWRRRADDTERLGDPLPRDPGAFSGQRQRYGRAPRGPSGSALLLYVCSKSALLGDLLGVSRPRERDLSVLSIYHRIFLRVFILYRLVLGILFYVVIFYYMLMFVGCFGLVVSICQVIGSKDPAEDALCDDNITST